MIERVDASLVKPGDMVPGLGRVSNAPMEVGLGGARKVIVEIDDCFVLVAKGDGQTIPVERDD